MSELLNFPVVGGASVGLLLSVNVLIIRYIRAYQRETRDEYARRLTKTVIELESLKTENAKLHFDMERLLFLRNSEK